MTEEKFETRISDNGQTEFVYGISWENTSQESLLRKGRQEIDRPRKDSFNSRSDNQRLDIQANNQTKLDLEDRAANTLKLKLEKEQLCLKGYEISNVVWKADNIRLLGYCF
ncbi:hypothetical protein [uncultured Paraglaciecola sp.]|uniref:hypothetical protein n=1 Tax=uncultured Paraglaciecola sp. TaxID=1765024 RepID=UPI002594952C|nr:hypothetical protein [uncultured Paraglaciecola sp.]